ncbi:MAG: CpaF family protein [Candidatus Dormibacteraeota bacterium]|nr:CpaF family protein [Candidatus Dormibacteraeota bacterium]
MAQLRDRPMHHPTVEIATLFEVTVHLLGGQVLEGLTNSREITRRGFPLHRVGGDGDVTWVPLANLKYVALGGVLEPDDGDSEQRKGLLSFRDGDSIQGYLAGGPGGEGFMIRMRVQDTEYVSPVLVCSQALLEMRFVDRWGVGLDQWTAAPRRRRSDRSGQQAPAEHRGSRIAELSADYRDRLSMIRDADLSTGDQESFTRSVRLHIDQMLDEDQLTLTMAERTELIDQILLQAVGYGPLDRLLRDPAVSEIMVNGTDDVFVERDGMLVKAEAHFTDEGQLLETIRRMIAVTGRHIDELSPMVDARLPDGSRVNAIIRPAALRGPSLTIRKFRDFVMDIDDLLREGSLSPAMADFLRACVLGRMNILVSGGTGSGKTTSLNVMASYIPENQRVVTIEDAAELQIQHPHVVALEHRPANIEGKGELTIRQLVRNSLRMRPDRILVGEVRGGEALDMLQAMNTGHDGSMSTIHSNSARDALSRLETMVMMASIDLPYEAVRAQIGSALNLLVHLARMPDGRRKIVQVAEVLGYNADGPVLRDIYVLGMGADLHLEYNATGYIPKLLDKAAFYGVQVPERLFDPEFARYIPAGADSMMPVIKDPVMEDETRRRSGNDVIREVVVVPFNSNPTTYPSSAQTAAAAAHADRHGGQLDDGVGLDHRDRMSPVDPMEAARMAQTVIAASPGLSEDVRDLISAARDAVGGAGPGPSAGYPTGGGGGAAGVAPSTSERVFVPRWQAPPLSANRKATANNARRRVAAVIDSLVVYVGLGNRLARTVNAAFNGAEIKIGVYAKDAKISSTTASRDLKRAAAAGLLVAQRHPQLGVTYRAGSFLMQAVAYGLGLNFGEAEALNADSILSKVIASMSVTK